MCAFLPSLFSNDKIKSLFTPWKLGSISKSKNRFFFFIATFDLYLFQLIVLLKPDFNILIVVIVSHYFGLTQLKQDHKVLHLLLQILFPQSQKKKHNMQREFFLLFFILDNFLYYQLVHLRNIATIFLQMFSNHYHYILLNYTSAQQHRNILRNLFAYCLFHWYSQ